MFSIGNEEEFLEVFAREVIKASSNKWQEWLGSGKGFFNKLIPKDAGLGSPKTVGNYLRDLEENNYLKSIKIGKEKLYLNHQLMSILETNKSRKA